MEQVEGTVLGSCHCGRRLTLAATGLLALSLVLAPRETFGIPAFARATGLACSSCHTAWPKLNRFGRAFKENGFVVERGNPEHQLEVGDRLSIPEIPPFAVVFNSRPFDRKKRGRRKLRALHELSLLTGASVFKYGSIFGEIEMEDEDNFDPKLAHAWGGFHPHQAFNVIGGYAPVFAADPYNTLVDRRLTRSTPIAINAGFESGVSLRANSQFVSAYGREPFLNKGFYLFSFSADRGGDVEGEGDEDFTGRLAFDVTKQFTIGAFGIAGRERRSPRTNQDFWRVGGDAQLQYGPLNVETVYIEANDDLLANDPSGERGKDDNNFAFSSETYLVLDHELFPDLPDWFFKFVPLVRTDYFTEPGSKQKRTDLAVNLTYYVFENAKASVEFAQQLHGEGDEQRVTVFLEFAL
ncbi:MAG: hypothetical protein ACE5I7_08145 [Candidatus Binatia bacterium]